MQTDEVPALAAGTYVFRCDVHPEMTGELVVKKATGPEISRAA